MENSDTSETSYSLPSLLCQENEACFGEEEQDQYMNLDPCLFSQSEDEYIQSLVKRETKSTMSSDNRSITNQSWLKRARLDSIKWVLNTRAFFGFQYRTAYLCVAYFDLFLSRRSIDNEKFWATRLLSVACLSLAAKMEELRVPNLSEFPVEGYYFDNKVIRRMELMVLETLEWKMLSITPFDFIPCFINKFCGESKSKELVSRTMELLLAITREVNLMDHRPSVIAAAAVLAAFDGQLTRKTMDCKMSVISLWGSRENEHIFSCYSLLQEIEMGKSKTPKQLISPNLSLSDNSSSIDVDESSFTSAVGSKRRLIYNDCDEVCQSAKICHR
ncbi:hypothetical protein AAG906_024254 [Vitis piasezkii]